MKPTTFLQPIEYIDGRFVNVKWNYIHEESEVRYYSDGTGYPGSNAEIEILEVHNEGVEITKYLHEKAFEVLERLIWKYMEQL